MPALLFGTFSGAMAQREFTPEVYQYLNKANERENLDEIGRKGYDAKEWRMEAPNNDVKSVDDIFAFRWMGGPFRNTGADSELPDTNYVHTREGLDHLALVHHQLGRAPARLRQDETGR